MSPAPSCKSILDMESLKHLPVAERIGVEFTAWGSASLIALVALTYHRTHPFWESWFKVLPSTARPAADTYRSVDLTLGYAASPSRSRVDAGGVYRDRRGR